ncbi:hypothetical protein ABZ559_11270 [Streptococcus sp. ZY19097]|uniref:hypothetical protein n=1 Tax=Streptococcus sp. ZY19097 TaxID=3231906 RepID=UPI00345B314F
MKKVTLGTITLLSILTLAACSSNKESTTTSSKEKTEQSSSTTQSKTKVDNSKYNDTIKEIKEKLDPDNTGGVTVEIENNVTDSEYPDGHNIIRVLLTGESQKAAKEALDAVYSNTATTDQSNTITLFRMTISELAKNLPDDTTTIDFGYEQSADQYDLIAKSSKTKDVIPVGDLIVE